MPMPEGAANNPSNYSPLLTNMAISYLPGFNEFIAGQVFPTITVGASAGTYNVWTRGDFMRRGGKELANYEAAPIEGFASSSRNYSVKNWGVAAAWTARELAEARAGGTSDADFIKAKVKFVTWKGALEKEIAVSVMCQTTANWTLTRAGVTSGPSGVQFIQWDQTASSPVDDFIAWIELMRLSAGIKPNTAIIPIQVINVLRKNVSLIDRIKYGGTMSNPTEVTVDQIKGLIGVDRILIPEGVYNTSEEGVADAFGYIWGKTCWLGYVADTPNRETPSAGYSIAWNGNTTAGLPVGMQSGAGPQTWGASPVPESLDGLFIRRYRTDRPSAEFVESELWITPNITAADMGMTITAPVA